MAEQEEPALTQTEEEMEEDGREEAADTGATAGKKPKFPCLRCRKNVGRQKGVKGVQCKTCLHWVHADCQGLSKEVYNLIANPEKYGGFCWNCDSCMASTHRLEAIVKAYETRIQEVEARAVRTEGRVQDVEKRVENVEKKQEGQEERMERREEQNRQRQKMEWREREIRRKNVVMHRIEEAGEEATRAEERKEWDLCSCENIFKALKMETTDRTAVKFIRRVGERREEPRPMVVGFWRESTKEEIIEKARELRNTNFTEVGIVPDLTQEQRKEEEAMVGEVEKRNEKRTEEDRAKNLEWIVVGKKGEKRIIKGVARQWGGTQTGGQSRGRGGNGGGEWRGRGGRVTEGGSSWRGGARGTGRESIGEARGGGWRGGAIPRTRINSKRTYDQLAEGEEGIEEPRAKH